MFSIPHPPLSLPALVGLRKSGRGPEIRSWERRQKGEQVERDRGLGEKRQRGGARGTVGPQCRDPKRGRTERQVGNG